MFRGGGMAAAGLIGSAVPSVAAAGAPASPDVSPASPDVYTRIGVRPFINLTAAVTINGGLLTLLDLLWNAFILGFGLSTLARGSPEAIPLALRYVPLEFSAFVLAASAAEHLSFMVLRCLAAGETPRFTSVIIALAVAIAMLVAAAIIEADVTRLVAVLAA